MLRFIILFIIAIPVSNVFFEYVFAFQLRPPDKQLTAQWWDWIFSIRLEDNPLIALEKTGEDYCRLNQSGSVWYLAGTLGGSAERPCIIPEGKSILFPIIYVFCSEIIQEGTDRKIITVPIHADLPQSIQKQGIVGCAEFFIDKVDNVQVTVDGADVQIPKNFRVQSPPFKIEYPSNNVFRVESTNQPQSSISDGYWILLSGLEPGLHTIQFLGSISEFGFESDVTYYLTIR